jgi:type II secretion system protein J
MRRARRAPDGFTLIELLVALSIFAIVSLAVYSAFAGGITAWRRAREFSSTHQTARLLLEDMAQELRNAVQISGAHFVGETQRVSFLTLRPAPSPTGRPATRQITSVTYEVQRARGASSYSLFRTEAPYAKNAQRGRGEPVLMVDSIGGLDFQYTHKNRDGEVLPWKGAWDVKDALPLGVKMTLVVGETRFTKTVFIPHGLQEKDHQPKG